MIEKRYCLTPEEWAYAKAELVLAECEEEAATGAAMSSLPRSAQ